MFKTINGYTKTKMIAKIKKYNNGKKAIETDAFEIESCVYQTEKGNRCAIGCFIPIKYLKDAVQGGGVVSDLLNKVPEVEDYMPLEHRGLVHFQSMHDSWDQTDPMSLRKTLIKWIENNVEDSV